MADVIDFDPEAIRISAKRAADFLKLIGNEHRLMILCHLVDGEKPVSELELVVDIGQSALSQHLARLRRDNLVTTRRVAQSIYYRISSSRALSVINLMHQLFCLDNNNKDMNDDL